MGMILTTLPWSRHVLARLLAGHPSTGKWNLHLRMKWPSKLHAAPPTCGAATRIHCCPPNHSSVAPVRSALKFKACAVDVNESLGCTLSLQPLISTEHRDQRTHAPSVLQKPLVKTEDPFSVVLDHNDFHYERSSKGN